MPEPLEADLELSVESALTNVDQLGSNIDETLTSAADSFSSAMADAVSGIPEIEVDPDVTAIEPAITDAIASADTGITADLEDTSGITAGIDEAFAGADTGITADFDGGGLAAEVEGALAGVDTELEFTADTSEAVASVEALGEASSSASGGVDGLATSASGVNAASGLATGSVAGLGSAIGETGGVSGTAVGIFTAVAVATGAMFDEAVDATGAQQRFNSTLGESADAVENLESIKGLNTNLSELALTLGSDDDKVRQTASRLFELATASGVAEDAASEFTQQTIAMGARALALNPTLGDLGDVTDGLSTAFVRGGRFATKYGLDLNQADINQRALADTGKRTTAELTFVEKAMAGAAIASEKYGKNLDEVVARGAENAITQQKRLKQTIVENIEAAGMPLVMPIFGVMEAGIPIVKAFGEIIATVAEAGIPILAAVLEGLLPFLEAFAQGLTDIGPGALQVGLALLVLYKIIDGYRGLLKAVTIAFSANPYLLLAVGIVTVVGALGIFTSSSQDSAEAAVALGDAVETAGGKFDESAAKIARDALQREHLLDNLTKASVGFGEYTSALETSSGATDKSIQKANDLILQMAHGDVSTRQWTTALTAISPELGALAARLAESGQLSDHMAITLINQATATHAGADAIKEQTKAGAENVDITKQQADAEEEEKATRDAQTAAVNAYKQALDDLTGRALSLAEAELGNASAQEKVVAAYAQAVDASHTADQVERGHTEALIGSVRAAQSLATATYDSVNATSGSAAAQTAADAVMRTFAQGMRDQLITGFGLSAEAADALLLKLGITPAMVAPAADALSGLGGVATVLQTQAALASIGINASFEDVARSAGFNMAAASTAVATEGGKAAGAATTSAVQAATGWGSGLGGIPEDTKAKIGAAGPAIEQVGGDLAVGVAFGAGTTVGDAFAAGMAFGITNGMIDVGIAAANLAEAAVTSAKAHAKIDSPSKVFMELGGHIGEGLAIGIDDSAVHVIDAAERIIQGAAGQFPTAPGGGGGGSTTNIELRVEVHGVTDERQARKVGREVGNGAVDALAMRGVLVAARAG